MSWVSKQLKTYDTLKLVKFKASSEMTDYKADFRSLTENKLDKAWYNIEKIHLWNIP